MGISDHSPIIVRVKESLNTGRKAFSFFNLWVTHPRFKQIVKDGWSTRVEGTAMYQLVQNSRL